MSFKDIKGQDEAVSFLKKSLENKRIPHAYIFLGPKGIGKKLAALNFAKALNCQAETTDKPCDMCASCRKIDNSNHPDVFLLKTASNTSSVKIGSIRELIRSVVLKPYEAKKKVYIIDDAGAMTQEASNAILKTLEEPPSDSILILIADKINTLLPTIISRAQIIRFFPLKVDEIKDILVNVYKIDSAKAHVISHLSSGRLGDALRYKDEDFFEKRSWIIKGLIDRTFFDFDFDDLSKEELKLYLDIMLTWYRDILITKAGAKDPSALINIDKQDALVAEARHTSFDYLDRVMKQIFSTNSFLEQNVNPKLAMSVVGLAVSGIGED